MSDSTPQKFGTLPVFLTSISTILGAILFLRFGWAVGSVGLLGTLLIVLVGHLVTIPTSLAIAEIATNQRVEGGGAYYIISRSFGLNIGGAIGIALYLSQAISVAFYVVAFAESAIPLFDWVESEFGLTIPMFGGRIISIPTMILLSILVLTRGANSGMSLLYVVASILFISLLLFFLGGPAVPLDTEKYPNIFNNVFDPADFSAEQLTQLGFLEPRKEEFFYVFTIIFPAFTGIIAGLGLSGDLRDPGKSIPIGTLTATVVGMVIYVAVAFKMAYSLPPEVLANKDRLVMADIALWAPIIPIGLACAAISSALGSVLVAPRTLQALGGDNVLPSESGNAWLSRIRKKDNEPINGSLVTVVISFFFVMLGEIDEIAEIISMFFMVTYGAICLISFLEHLSANPAYRPSFNSRWYFSLLGAILCIYLMFSMNQTYAILSVLLMVGIYFWVSRYNTNSGGMVRIFQGTIFQISRTLRVLLQRANSEEEQEEYWVPSVVCFSQDSFERLSAFDTLRFISHRHGFGTYIHMVQDYLSKSTIEQSKELLNRLLQRTKVTQSNLFVDTLISPSYTSAVAQVLQLPGVSGQDNNTILFEYSANATEPLTDILDNVGLIKDASFDLLLLRTTEKGFGYKHEIHIWLTADDYVHGNLMILLAYIILGHPEWRGGLIKIFAVYPEAELKQQKEQLLNTIGEGRLPISSHNVEFIARKKDTSLKGVIRQRSQDADLTLLGLQVEKLETQQEEIFTGYGNLANILFVHTDSIKVIS